ncbi:MAG: Flp pilus assembly complex ATPase component TadA [Phycisphaerae bacterium]|nr:Flp pilus assembly complex ATPase component TadA [Phycisphaerae bacterium]
MASSLEPTTNVPILLAEGFFLLSFWKPIIPLIILGGWAWIISTVYDKHAARFFLPRERWNLVHLCFGAVALAAAFFLPLVGEVAFWVAVPVMVLVLIIDLVVYAMVANRDDRVPAEFRISLDIAKRLAARKESKKAGKAAAAVKLGIRSPDKSLVAPPEAETPEYEVRTAAEGVYLKAMENRASQVDLVPAGKDNAYQARMLVDGVAVNGDAFPGPAAVKVMDFWKSAAKLDLADRRKKLQAEVTVEQGSNKRKVRITSVGVQGGMRLTMLFDPDTAVKRAASEIGLLDQQLAEVKKLVDTVGGVVLIAAPPDGGRTTLFYSVLALHDAYTQNVATVELDQQLQLDGVRHQVFDPTVEGTDYATTVRSMLRRDPNVLGVAEMPDAKTAEEAARVDAERTRLYLCVRADNAMQALEGYVKAVGDPAKAAKTLRGVIAGRLLRKLCTNCRVSSPPSADMLTKMGVPEGKVQALFKKGGQVLIKNKPEVCPVCSGVGYLGQEGIFEVYTIGEEERAMIAANNLAGVKAAWRKQATPTIQQAAFAKAIRGTTSVEEVMRVTAPPAPAQTQPAPAAAAKA